MAESIYKFYQKAQFSDKDDYINSIRTTERNLGIINRRINSLDRQGTPWKLYKDGKLYRQSK